MSGMYRAEADPYCYPGTSVLINKLGTQNQAELDAFEAEMTSDRATEELPSGRFGYTHYRAIHRHLFQDIYDWAGKPRTVRISKGTSAFCYPEHIDRQMKRLFDGLKRQKQFKNLDATTFANKASHFLAELNAVHPFREGNGRTQLTFLIALAENAIHPLDVDKLEPQAILDAVIASFDGDEKPLEKIIAGLI